MPRPTLDRWWGGYFVLFGSMCAMMLVAMMRISRNRGGMTQPGSQIEPTTRMSKLLRYSLAFFIFAGAFAGSFFLNTRHNSFPYGFHPDEPSKADQILSGYRNFLHPQLMLEVAQHALNWSRTPRDIQGATELGREVSAVFAAT